MRHLLTTEQLKNFGNFLDEVIFEKEVCYLRFEAEYKEWDFDCGYEIVEGRILSYYSDGEFMQYFDPIYLPYCIEMAEFHANEMDNQIYFT